MCIVVREIIVEKRACWMVLSLQNKVPHDVIVRDQGDIWKV